MKLYKKRIRKNDYSVDDSLKILRIWVYSKAVILRMISRGWIQGILLR